MLGLGLSYLNTALSWDFLILNYNFVAQEISIFSKYVHIALLDHRDRKSVV